MLAVASGGGHWQQLMRLRPAFDHHRAIYVTTNRAYAADVPGSVLHVVTDANRSEPVALMRTALEMLALVAKTRPHTVISTGAAPGLLALLCGKLVGAKTIWVDSIANAEAVSLSGRLALRFADVVLTQWPHLAAPAGAQHHGSIL